MFSDESTLQQFVMRKRHIRRHPGKRFEDCYTIQTMKHPPSQMIWGAMSKSGTAGLYFLPQGTTMNVAKYVELLREKLKLHMYIHQCSIFMHDGMTELRATDQRLCRFSWQKSKFQPWIGLGTAQTSTLSKIFGR